MYISQHRIKLSSEVTWAVLRAITYLTFDLWWAGVTAWEVPKVKVGLPSVLCSRGLPQIRAYSRGKIKMCHWTCGTVTKHVMEVKDYRQPGLGRILLGSCFCPDI